MDDSIIFHQKRLQYLKKFGYCNFSHKPNHLQRGLLGVTSDVPPPETPPNATHLGDT